MPKTQLYVHEPGHPEPHRHNYFPELQALIAEQGELDEVGVSRVHIYHDDWCDIFIGGYCNCAPDIQVEKLVHQPAG
ncbi:MAG: hypothetical protein H8D78_20575 [Chloroflexi bacterium]|nr:hypothetical protein [Chloroflexota bacterium]